MKKPIIIAGAVAAVSFASIGGAGIASAMTDRPASNDWQSSEWRDGSSSLAERLSLKFNLDKDVLQAEIDQELALHQEEMQKERNLKISAAVESGELTQDQADHILSVFAEVDAMHDDVRSDDSDNDDAAQDKMDSTMLKLQAWLDENKIDLNLLLSSDSNRSEDHDDRRGLGGLLNGIL